MANVPTISPDVYAAAVMIAANDHISVDVALARLRRAARAAGISPQAMAAQVTAGARSKPAQPV